MLYMHKLIKVVKFMSNLSSLMFIATPARKFINGFYIIKENNLINQLVLNIKVVCYPSIFILRHATLYLHGGKTIKPKNKVYLTKIYYMKIALVSRNITTHCRLSIRQIRY